jgi:hypothetical protein
MHLGGPGGTGKSRVIHALTDFFKRKSQSRRLRLAAFTGVAAKNIGGTTLHTALCMSITKKKSEGNKTRTDLVAMWDGVDYLFVDKVSTLGYGFRRDFLDKNIHIIEQLMYLGASIGSHSIPLSITPPHSVPLQCLSTYKWNEMEQDGGQWV